MANGDGEIKDLWKKVSDIAENGCAQRKGDEERMKRVEESNRRIHGRLDFITYALIANLAALIINLASKYLGK
jgi:hypothetical protein